MKVMKGIIKTWHSDGHGLILGQDDIIYHTTLQQMVNDGTPVQGWCVQFNPWNGAKGPMAINVKQDSLIKSVNPPTP